MYGDYNTCTVSLNPDNFEDLGSCSLNQWQKVMKKQGKKDLSDLNLELGKLFNSRIAVLKKLNFVKREQHKQCNNSKD